MNRNQMSEQLECCRSPSKIGQRSSTKTCWLSFNSHLLYVYKFCLYFLSSFYSDLCVHVYQQFYLVIGPHASYSRPFSWKVRGTREAKTWLLAIIIGSIVGSSGYKSSRIAKQVCTTDNIPYTTCCTHQCAPYITLLICIFCHVFVHHVVFRIDYSVIYK